jgi:hypothetical protein
MKLELLTTAHNDASIHEGSSTTLKDFRSIRNPNMQGNVPKYESGMGMKQASSKTGSEASESIISVKIQTAHSLSIIKYR